MEFTLIYRSRIVISAYKNWIMPSDRVLDAGCGNAVVSEELRRHYSCSVVGTDILDYRKRAIPFKIMTEPGRLPFGNGEFDICMFNDALHHCNDQEGLLQEAARVAGTVLIFEAEPTFTAKAADFITNLFHNRDMNIPFNMRTPDEWRDCFKRLKFGFEYRKIRKPNPIYPFSNFAFNLKKGA